MKSVSCPNVSDNPCRKLMSTVMARWTRRNTKPISAAVAHRRGPEEIADRPTGIRNRTIARPRHPSRRRTCRCSGSETRTTIHSQKKTGRRQLPGSSLSSFYPSDSGVRPDCYVQLFAFSACRAKSSVSWRTCLTKLLSSAEPSTTRICSSLS